MDLMAGIEDYEIADHEGDYEDFEDIESYAPNSPPAIESPKLEMRFRPSALCLGLT